MATASGHESVAVDKTPEPAAPPPERMAEIRKLLEEEPFRVRFFQAVRLLQRLEKDREPVGRFSKPQDETIRFSSLPSLAFPPSDLYDIERMSSGQVKMTVQFTTSSGTKPGTGIS